MHEHFRRTLSVRRGVSLAVAFGGLLVARGAEAALTRYVSATDGKDLPRDQPVVVYRVDVPAVGAGDSLLVRAQVGVTQDLVNNQDEGKTAEFHTVVRLNGADILGPMSMTVPSRMHHAVVPIEFNHPVAAALAPATVEVVVTMTTGGDECANGCTATADPGHGRLDVIHAYPGPPNYAQTQTIAMMQGGQQIECPKDPPNPDDPIDPKYKEIVVSQDLGPVAAGEIFDVVASIAGHADFNGWNTTLISGYLIVADAPDAIDSPYPTIAAQHGFNLFHNDPHEPDLSDGVLVKVGTFRADAAIAHGHVQFVVRSGAGCDENMVSGAHLDVSGGTLRVDRFTPLEPEDPTGDPTGDTADPTGATSEPTGESGESGGGSSEPPGATTDATEPATTDVDDTAPTPTTTGAGATTGAGDGSGATSPGDPPEQGPTEAGCGCSTGVDGVAWTIAGVLPLVARRRRSRRPSF